MVARPTQLLPFDLMTAVLKSAISNWLLSNPIEFRVLEAHDCKHEVHAYLHRRTCLN
jgi:hypothetical protein